MSWLNFFGRLGSLLAATLVTGTCIVAVFEGTHNLLLRIVGVLLSLATCRAMLIFEVPAAHSTINRIATAGVGILFCWPVVDLTNYWLGLDSFWDPSRFGALGAWRIIWLFTGIFYFPIMIVSGVGLFRRGHRP